VTVFLRSVRQLLVTAKVVPSSPILVTLMLEVLSSSETSFLQEPHGVTSQKTPFFIVTAVITSNLTYTRHVARENVSDLSTAACSDNVTVTCTDSL
jgi:hypothetical protein